MNEAINNRVELDNIIAESCGWTHIENANSMAMSGMWVGYPPSMFLVGKKQHVPNYSSDLNAMHEAEMTLSDVPPKAGEKSDRSKYRENLCVECLGSGGPIMATALQRATAFVKTIQK